MTDSDLAHAVKALALAVSDLQERLTRLEAFALSTYKRLQIREAEMAVYEMKQDERGRLN